MSDKNNLGKVTLVKIGDICMSMTQPGVASSKNGLDHFSCLNTIFELLVSVDIEHIGTEELKTIISLLGSVRSSFEYHIRMIGDTKLFDESLGERKEQLQKVHKLIESTIPILEKKIKV